jgi:hypothetical protein
VIVGLVIGPPLSMPAAPGMPSEATVDERCAPSATRSLIWSIYRAQSPWRICTYSPFTIACVMEILDRDPSMVLLRRATDDGQKITASLLGAPRRPGIKPAGQVFEADWLAHFALGDLLIRGELDHLL